MIWAFSTNASLLWIAAINGTSGASHCSSNKIHLRMDVSQRASRSSLHVFSGTSLMCCKKFLTSTVCFAITRCSTVSSCTSWVIGSTWKGAGLLIPRVIISTAETFGSKNLSQNPLSHGISNSRLGNDFHADCTITSGSYFSETDDSSRPVANGSIPEKSVLIEGSYSVFASCKPVSPTCVQEPSSSPAVSGKSMANKLRPPCYISHFKSVSRIPLHPPCLRRARYKQLFKKHVLKRTWGEFRFSLFDKQPRTLYLAKRTTNFKQLSKLFVCVCI